MTHPGEGKEKMKMIAQNASHLLQTVATAPVTIFETQTGELHCGTSPSMGYV